MQTSNLRLIPIPGEWHFVAHCTDSVHKLWWPCLSGWAVEKLGFEKVVKETDDNITHFNHYDALYQLLTIAILIVLYETLDINLLLQPQVLIDATKQNTGTCVSRCSTIIIRHHHLPPAGNKKLLTS